MITTSENHGSTSSEEQKDEGGQSYEWHSTFSPKDLQPFCEQLGKFLKYVQELASLTYEYPSTLQERLEAEANELQSLYLEVRANAQEVERIKHQRKCVHKEQKAAKKMLKKLHDDEVREMEAAVSTHDKVMYTRWQNLKNTSKPHLLQGFLNDIKEKQEALDHLNMLVSSKLEQITPLSMPWNGANNFLFNKNTKDTKEEKRKLNTKNSVNRCHHGCSAIPRWTGFGRNSTINLNRTVTFAQQQENSNLPVVPFTTNNLAFQFFNRNANESLSAIDESASIHLFRENAASTDNGTGSTAGTDNNNSSNNSSNTTGPNETQNDMSNVLHALFGQIQQNPIPDSDVESNDDSNDSISDGIELFRHF